MGKGSGGCDDRQPLLVGAVESSGDDNSSAPVLTMAAERSILKRSRYSAVGWVVGYRPIINGHFAGDEEATQQALDNLVQDSLLSRTVTVTTTGSKVTQTKLQYQTSAKGIKRLTELNKIAKLGDLPTGLQVLQQLSYLERQIVLTLGELDLPKEKASPTQFTQLEQLQMMVGAPQKKMIGQAVKTLVETGMVRKHQIDGGPATTQFGWVYQPKISHYALSPQGQLVFDHFKQQADEDYTVDELLIGYDEA